MLWNPHVSHGVYVMRAVICFMLSISLSFTLPLVHLATGDRFTLIAVSPLTVFMLLSLLFLLLLLLSQMTHDADICMDHHRSLNIAFIVLSSGRNRSWTWSWTWSRSGTGNRQVPPPLHGSKPLANVASVAIVQTSSVLSFATLAWLLMAFERTW